MKKLLLGLVVAALALLALAFLLLRPAGEAQAPEDVASPSAPADVVEPEVDRSIRAPAEVPVRADATPRVEQVTTIEKVHGVVFDTALNAPVVQLPIEGALEQRGVRRTRTDKDGRFTLEVKAGLVRVSATPLGHAGWCEHLVLEPGQTATLTKELGGPALSIRAWTAWKEELEPIDEAEVRVVAVLDDASLHVGCPLFAGPPTAITDARGLASFSTLPGSMHMVQVRAEGHHPRTFVLDLERREVEDCVHVVLEPRGAPIRGRILSPNGQPLAGAMVMVDARRGGPERVARFGRFPQQDANTPTELEPELHPPFVVTGPDGRYEIHAPRPNAPQLVDATLLVFPQREGLVHHHSLPLPKTTLEAARDLDVRLPAAQEITIEFVNPEGFPMPDGPASARDIDGRAYAPTPEVLPGQQLTQTAGRYFATSGGVFRFLHGGGTVRVGLSPEGAWRGQEVGIVIPPDGSKTHFRLTLPY